MAVNGRWYQIKFTGTTLAKLSADKTACPLNAAINLMSWR